MWKSKANVRLKRLLSVILAVLVLMTGLPLSVFADQTTADNGIPFTDVSKSSWYYDAVRHVYGKGIFQGTTPTKFGPHEGMTRAMFVTALGRFAGVDTDEYSGTGGFSDVGADAYYAPYVAWASEKGIARGVGDGRFAPGSLVTREQIATFAAKYINAYDIRLPDADAGKTPPHDLQNVSAWAKDSLLTLWNVGIFNGDDKGLFNPRANMKRSETAQFFMNMDAVLNNDGPKPSPSPSPSPDPGGVGGTSRYTVRFETNGGPALNPVQVQRGGTLPSVPQPAREGYVFAGWYTDAGFTRKFDETNAITASLTLYAQYIDVGGPVQKQLYNEDVQLPEVVEDDPVQAGFAVAVSANGFTADQVKAGLRLSITSGMDDRDFTVSGSGPDFTVTMTDGWTPGVSYKLEAADPAITFDKDATKTARLYYFTADREKSDVLPKKEILYLPSSAVNNILVDGGSVGSISSGIYNFDADGNQNNQALAGSFTLGSNHTVNPGDILCVFDGKSPENAVMGDTIYDDIAYIKVTNVSGDQIEFTNAKPEEVLDVPKTALVKKDAVTAYSETAGGFSFKSATDQFDSFAVGDDAAVNRPLETGDTVALYEGLDFLSITDPNQITLGRVTNISGSAPNFTVTCESVTAEELEETVDYHQTVPLDADELIDKGYIDEEKIIKQMEKQARGSGIIDELAKQYALMALETDLLEDGETNTDGLQVVMDDGSLAGSSQLRSIMETNLQKGVSVEDPKVEPKITRGGGKYGDTALVATLTITFALKMENANKDSIAVNFEIEFTQEVYLGVGADAGISWHKILGIPIFPEDVWISAYLDTKTYSAVNLKATANTKLAKPEKIKDPDTGKEVEVTEKKLDIASKINKIIDSFDEKEAYDEVSGIYKTYQDFMANDWTYVELVRTNLLTVPISVAGGLVKMEAKADFVLSAAANVSLTCKIAYQDGMRYSLNVRLGGPSVTFTQTQIVDKKFNFDVFFVGRFGMKAGIELSFKAGLISTKLNSVSVAVQVGLYLEWMGFFSYKFEKNFSQVTTKSVAQGAMYAEVGVYLDANAEAQAGNGKWKATIDLLSLQFPLLSTESQNYVYGYSFKLDEGEKLIINRNKNALPDNVLKMIQLDLKGGKSYLQAYPKDRFSISFTDSAFSLTADNKIKVDTTKDYLEAEMILAWRGSPLAFTTMPLILKIPVVFTADSALVEKGLLTVKDQNDSVIWEKRVEFGKNIADELPRQEEILNLLGYDNFEAALANSSTVNLKYADKGGYTATPSGTVTGNAAFTYQIPEREYTVTVDGIQEANGNTRTGSFTAKYGGRFDFSSLSSTGTDQPGTAYTKFSKVQTKKGANAEGLSLQDQLTRDLAVQILDGSHTYHAVYDDDSARVTYAFISTFGAGIPNAQEILRKGSKITYNFRQAVEDDGNYVIASVDFDENAAVTSSRTLRIYCKSANEFMLKFELNGGNFATGYHPPQLYNPLDGTALPTKDNVTRTDKIFIGWFTDGQFTGDPVETAIGENGVMTFYAMWRDPAYTVKFDANGGTGSMSELSANYGTSKALTTNTLTPPQDEYIEGGAFLSWNTKADGSGESYTNGGFITTPAVDKNGTVTLYAQWKEAPKVDYQPADTGSTVERGTMSMAEALACSAQEPGTIKLLESITLKKGIELPNGTVFDGDWVKNADNITVKVRGAITLFHVAQGNSAEIKNVRIYNPESNTIDNSGTLYIEDVCVTGARETAVVNQSTGKMSLRYMAVMGSTAGVIINRGTIAVDNCSFSGISTRMHNEAVIANLDVATAVVNNTTIINNTNPDTIDIGGSAFHNAGGNLYVVNSSIGGNTGGAAIRAFNGNTYVVNSIVATNTRQDGTWLPFSTWVNSPVTICNSITSYTTISSTDSYTSYDEASGTIFVGSPPNIGTSPADNPRGGHLRTPNFNQKPTELKSLATQIYLDYSDLGNIRLGYGSDYLITPLLGNPLATDRVSEYLGGGSRAVNDNRVGASYVTLP